MFWFVSSTFVIAIVEQTWDNAPLWINGIADERVVLWLCQPRVWQHGPCAFGETRRKEPSSPFNVIVSTSRSFPVASSSHLLIGGLLKRPLKSDFHCHFSITATRELSGEGCRGRRRQPPRVGVLADAGGRDGSLASLPPGERDTGETRASPPAQKAFLSPLPSPPGIFSLFLGGGWVEDFLQIY